jgi:hypothetical protein
MDKSFILDEIRRTAATNGGKPLGQEGFASETGIKAYDWNKHWARWSRALAEAGFAANQLTQPIELTELLEKYAQFALEIGHLPTYRDTLVRRSSDPQFPGTTTIGKRLGTGSSRVKKLIEYCRSNKDYQPVVGMCEFYLASQDRDADGAGIKKSTGQEVGFVYLIKAGRHYKIGRSKAIGRRERQLKIQLPEPANTVHVIRTDDPIGIEAYWHKRFEASRKNGEWFELNLDDVRAFKRRKIM